MAFQEVAHDIECLLHGHCDEHHCSDFCSAVGVTQTLVAPCDDPGIKHVFEVVVQGSGMWMEEVERGKGRDDILFDEVESGLGEEIGGESTSCTSETGTKMIYRRDE